MDKKLLSQTIYLETDEEITSIIGRLRESEANEIILVIPKGSELFKSVVNLKLIKKQADKFKKQISIVTTDKIGQNLAEKAGFYASGKIKKDGEKHIDFTEFEETDKKPDIKNNSAKIIAQDKIHISAPQPLKRTMEPAGNSFIKNTDVKDAISRVNNLKNNKPNKFSDIVRKDKKQNEALKIKPISEEAVSETGVKNEMRSGALFAKKEISKLAPDRIENLPAVATELQAGKKKTVVLLPALSAKFFLIFLVFCAIVTFGAAFLILPAANIAIIPKTEPLTVNLDIIADKNIKEIELGANKIPGQIISVEKEASQEFPATGIKKMEEKAKGTITIYNEWDSSSQILVKTTRFLSKDGKLFRTTKTVTVPGFSRVDGDDIPGTIDVEVIADKPGEDFNIDSTSFTIPGLSGTTKYSSIYGRSKEPMAGGIVGEVKIISEKDTEEAKNFLAVIFQEKAKNQLKEEIPKGLEILEDSSYEEIVEFNSSASVGDQADKFTQSIKVKSSIIAFSSEDLKKFISKSLVKSVAKERKVLSQSIEISYSESKIDFENGQMIISAHVEAKAIWKINEDEIKSQISGKNESELRSYLQNRKEIKRAKVSFWPFWVKRVPHSANKINLTIDSIEN